VSKQVQKGRFISVGTKLAVATVLVLAGLSIVLLKELTQRERRRLVDAKAIAGSMVTDLFAASCAAPLVFADNDAVTVELEKLRGNKAIVYAAVYSSKEDKTVGESNPQKRPSYDFRHGKTASQSVERFDAIEILKDIRDTHNEVVGFAVLNFSLADENAAFQISRRRMLWFAFFIAAGTATLLILLARRVIVKPLGRVTEAARRLEKGDLHARADVRSNDEVGNLASVFNSMGDAIVDREQKVVQAQKNVQDLFDNMLQAIFTVGPDGRINNEVSAFAKQIFGNVPIAGELVTEFLRLESVAESEAVSRMKFWLVHIFGTDDLQWDLSEPERIRQLNFVRTNFDGSTEERALELDYAPLYKDGSIVKIMFLVKDVTEVHRLQAEIARRDQQNQENLARIRQIASMEPDLFNTFISEAYSVLDGCEQSLADLEDPSRRVAAVNSLFRGMHTLKGNARMFKLTAVQDIAHATEDYFQKVRDGQVGLNGDIGIAMHERITEVRKLLAEFEKLGRQVLGGEQETPGDAALGFLRAQERPFDDWQSDLAALGDEGAEEARERLVGRTNKLRTDAQAHGFVSLVAACDTLLRELARQGVTGEQLVPCLQKANDALQSTRSLATEIASAELWPYFLSEAKVLLRSLAGKLAGTDSPDRSETGGEATDVVLLAAAARSFGLPTLANIATDCHRGMTKEGVEPRAVLNTLESWLLDARNLVEMKSRPELDIDLLGRFHNDAGELIDRLCAASPGQVAGLVTATIACARRHRFRAIQETFESLAKTHPKNGPRVAEALRQHLDAYENIRREIRDNEVAEHLLLVLPATANQGEHELDSWLAAATKAGLAHLTAHARSLPTSGRVHLLEDIRHFHILLPAVRGAKTGQPVQRVLEGRIAALRDSLRGLRQAVAHAHEDRKALLPTLQDLEKAVVHLTTSSLGDVLAPVASTACDLARERGKPLEEVSLADLDLFLDTKVMQKIRGAVVHAVRNAVDHGLETSDVRITAGKSPRGRIGISAQEREGWIDLAIEDDGRGVDTARVKEIALNRGLINAEQAAAMSADETYELLFLPGFSTAASVSSVSGRGVGMDAIRAIAHELGGEVKLSSTAGRGSRLTMHFPTQAPLAEAKPSKISKPAVNEVGPN
jgi:chemotaxis protein histidine kinase CheA/HAMP domain-containing protein